MAWLKSCLTIISPYNSFFSFIPAARSLLFQNNRNLFCIKQNKNGEGEFQCLGKQPESRHCCHDILWKCPHNIESDVTMHLAPKIASIQTNWVLCKIIFTSFIHHQKTILITSYMYVLKIVKIQVP